LKGNLRLHREGILVFNAICLVAWRYVELVQVGLFGHRGLLVISNIDNGFSISVQGCDHKIVSWLETARVLQSSDYNCFYGVFKEAILL